MSACVFRLSCAGAAQMSSRPQEGSLAALRSGQSNGARRRVAAPRETGSMLNPSIPIPLQPIAAHYESAAGQSALTDDGASVTQREWGEQQPCEILFGASQSTPRIPVVLFCFTSKRIPTGKKSSETRVPPSSNLLIRNTHFSRKTKQIN